MRLIIGPQVSSLSDTLSDSRPSATSNHTISFITPKSVYGSSTSGSSTIVVAPDSNFTFPSNMDCGDIDAATGTQFLFNYPSCAQTATAWGATTTGGMLTLIPPTGTGEYVATGTQITIKIGSNATVGQQGTHWITNPSSAGVYTISVGGGFGGFGNMLVSIGAQLTPTVQTVNFAYTGATTTWVVPNNVYSITITARGAGGQDGNGTPYGGAGGSSVGTLAVTPGTTYYYNHYCPGDDFFISRSRLMARQLSLDLRFFDLNCFSPELASGRLLGTRRRLPTMGDESWPNCFLPGRRSSSTL
jgi:hypothetical protein